MLIRKDQSFRQSCKLFDVSSITQFSHKKKAIRPNHFSNSLNIKPIADSSRFEQTNVKKFVRDSTMQSEIVDNLLDQLTQKNVDELKSLKNPSLNTLRILSATRILLVGGDELINDIDCTSNMSTSLNNSFFQALKPSDLRMRVLFWDSKKSSKELCLKLKRSISEISGEDLPKTSLCIRALFDWVLECIDIVLNEKKRNINVQVPTCDKVLLNGYRATPSKPPVFSKALVRRETGAKSSKFNRLGFVGIPGINCSTNKQVVPVEQRIVRKLVTTRSEPMRQTRLPPLMIKSMN
jgi:hypothetical protein